MEWLIDILQMFIGVLLVLLLAYVTTRVVSGKAAGLASGKYMNITDKIMLGTNKWLYIVQVGKEYFILSVTANRIECVGTLAGSDLIPLDTGNGLGFSSIFDSYTNRFRGIQGSSNNENRLQPLKIMQEKISRQLDLLKNNNSALKQNKTEDGSNEYQD